MEVCCSHALDAHSLCGTKLVGKTKLASNTNATTHSPCYLCQRPRASPQDSSGAVCCAGETFQFKRLKMKPQSTCAAPTMI